MIHVIGGEQWDNIFMSRIMFIYVHNIHLSWWSTWHDSWIYHSSTFDIIQIGFCISLCILLDKTNWRQSYSLQVAVAPQLVMILDTANNYFTSSDPHGISRHIFRYIFRHFTQHSIWHSSWQRPGTTAIASLQLRSGGRNEGRKEGVELT